MMWLKTVLKKISVLILLTKTISATALDAVPLEAHTDLKIGTHVVLQLGDIFHYTKIFGFTNKETQEGEFLILEFYQILNEQKERLVSGPYSAKDVTKVFYSLKGVTDLKYGDAVYVESRDAVAIVVGVYYKKDGFALHCLKFVGGELDTKIGCAWDRTNLQKVSKDDSGPFSSKAYVITSRQKGFFVVVGKINEKQVLLKNYNDLNKYIVADRDDLTSIRITELMSLDPQEAVDNKIKNEVTRDASELTRP